MVGGGTTLSASICRDDPTSANATGTGDQVLTAYRALDDTHGIANALQLQAWLTLAAGPDNRQQATALADQARALRARVKRALSPREQAEYRRLDEALGRM